MIHLPASPDPPTSAWTAVEPLPETAPLEGDRRADVVVVGAGYTGLSAALRGRDVVTIEGVTGKVAQAVQAAWRQLDVAQCGYCQSGQIMSAAALLTEIPRPSDTDIDAAMAGNVCRCATYVRIRAAIHEASRTLGG